MVQNIDFSEIKINTELSATPSPSKMIKQRNCVLITFFITLVFILMIISIKLSSLLEKNKKKIENLNQTKETLQKSLDNNEGSFNQAKLRQEQIQSINEKIDSALTKQRETIPELKEEYEKKKQQINDLNIEITDLKENIEKLKKQFNLYF